jgi:hypothetical protein
LNSLPTITRLSAYLKVLAALDHNSNAMTNDLVVVCNQNFRGSHHPTPSLKKYDGCKLK